jgi:2-hydroxy-3-oxopropionate reductase
VALDQTVGVIGLGVMGKPISRRLVTAGYDVVVFNRSRSAVDELVTAGASPAGSVSELTARCDVVITMLPDTPDVEAVVLGEDGVLEASRPGGLLIDMSTIAPSAATRIAASASAKGVEALDAPVSGGEVGAIDGTLSIMCGGGEAAVERALPIFTQLGSRVVHVGGPGTGQVVKACNQIVVGITLQAMAEALVLGAKAGVEPQAIVDALLGGAARCWALEVRGPSILRRDFKPGFRSRLHHKDLGLALATGAELGVTLPLTALVHELFGALKASGRGDYDHSALITLVEDLARFEVNGSPPSEAKAAHAATEPGGIVREQEP